MKKMLILALSLIILGGVMFTMTACSENWSFKVLFGGKFEENTSSISKDFNSIDILSDTADITLLPSEDGSCKVVSFNRKKIDYEIAVENGTLKIKSSDKRAWYERMFTTRGATLTVYLPANEYKSLLINDSTGNINIPSEFKFESIDIRVSTGRVNILASVAEFIKVEASTGDISVQQIETNDLELKTSTGDIHVTNVKCSGNMTISVSTGDVKLIDITCKNLTTDGTTGKFYLNNAIAEENVTVARDTGNVEMTNAELKGDLSVTVTTGKTALTSITLKNLYTKGDTGKLTMSDVVGSGVFDIERSTGDITFEACDAAELTVLTDTGDVSGSLLSEKIFITKTSTGKIRVPESVVGGKCKITTSTGDIEIEIK